MAASTPISSVPIAVIGGSGLYALLDPETSRTERIATPFGADIDVAIGAFAGTTVAFLPRHGVGHSVPPHRIPARAMLWALARLGVRVLVSTAAVGSLNERMPVGTIALADQLIDRTRGREDTFFDGDTVRHLPFSDPFAPALRSIALAAAPELVDTATVLVIPGPRFSTRAESDMNRAAGIDLVNMTLYPEAALAAELGIDAIALCVVTDVDSGSHADEAVTAEAVFARLDEARPRLVSAIERIVAAVPSDYTPRALIDRSAVDAVLRSEAR